MNKPLDSRFSKTKIKYADSKVKFGVLCLVLGFLNVILKFILYNIYNRALQCILHYFFKYFMTTLYIFVFSRRALDHNSADVKL